MPKEEGKAFMHAYKIKSTRQITRDKNKPCTFPGTKE